MIEVQNLTKRYAAQAAVSDVTFSVRQGEVVGFLGPNGAGKTTTMRVLTGFLPPSEGAARIAGYDIVTQSRRARASLGYLPESAALYPEMRVREYLTYRARLEGLAGLSGQTRVGGAGPPLRPQGRAGEGAGATNPVIPDSPPLSGA